MASLHKSSSGSVSTSWIVDVGSCRAKCLTDDDRVVFEVIWYDKPKGDGFELSHYSGGRLDFMALKELLREAKAEIAAAKRKV